MTHVKTAEAFARLVDFCTGYGGSYNPGRPTLQVEALKARLNDVQRVLQNAIVAKTALENASIERRQGFAQLSTLIGSILRGLEASGASAETVATARLALNRLRSRPQAPEGEQATPRKRVSQLQLAYVSKAAAFAKLVESVAAEPLYVMQEPHLAKEGLRAELARLQLLNQRVVTATREWNNARIERNRVLYHDPLSIVHLGRAVKRYVGAVFGPASETYRPLKSLVFTKKL